MIVCQSQSEEKNNYFCLLNYKDLGHNILCGIAPPSHTKAELNSLPFILLEEVSREKEHYFFPFSILVDPPLLCSILTLWSKAFRTNPVFSNSPWAATTVAD